MTAATSTRPLSARSIIASTLLGTHPPRMEGRLLVALASRFGVAEGTARVALSRMVDRGELTNVDGRYALGGRLLERQQRQDAAVSRPTRSWNGTWQQAIVTETGAGPRHRAERRASLANLKLAELRDGVWMRPANLDPDRLPAEAVWRAQDVLWTEVTVAEAQEVRLVAALWDLEALASTARSLASRLDEASSALDADEDAWLAPGFELSAAVLRHLLADPELPPELQPEGWPSADLRAAYERFDASYRRLLGRFFRSHAAMPRGDAAGQGSAEITSRPNASSVDSAAKSVNHA